MPPRDAVTLPAGAMRSEGPQAPAAAPGFIVTQGSRVALRTLVPSDLAYFTEWAEDPFLEEMVGSDFLHSYKHVYDKGPEFYEACLSDPTQVVLMTVPIKEQNRPIGCVRLFNIHLLEGYAFLETILADRRAIRRGFGVEAGRLISYYGVDVLGLRRIEAKVYEYNVLSMNTLRRNGFQQEGILRQAAFHGGRYCNVVIFGILRDEIEEQRRKDRVCYPLDG